jgi:hypothetical protein
MKDPYYTTLLPLQRVGRKCDNVSRNRCPTSTEAAMLFRRAKKRLKDINRWEVVAGKEKATFTLTDRFGHLIHRAPEVGDCIRIGLPKLKNRYGGGFDWVKIRFLQEREEEDYQLIILRVQPCPPPGKRKIAHFLHHKSSNTFLLIRKDKEVWASIHGRNETINYSTGLINSLRNVVAAWGGFMGLSQLQWQDFVEGLIERK